MSNIINQVDVLNALDNLMGRRISPDGTRSDLERYVQRGFDYCWRYYKWSFSLKTAEITIDGDGNAFLPDDFDLDGYRRAVGATEVPLDETIGSTGSTNFAIVWDFDENKYKTTPAVEFDLVYQITPPTLGTDAAGSAPFPSAMTVALAAAIYAKQGENPTRADIQQEWDELHSELDRHAGRADNNMPRRTVRNYHDKMGSFTGDVGA